MQKKILNAVFAILLIVVLLLPVGALLYISEQEQAQYTASEQHSIELEEFSYGTPSPIMLMDVTEKINLSGSVISTRILYEELELENISELRLVISSGTVLVKGDLIGYYQGREVLATRTGVIKSIHTGSDAYIELWSLDDLAIECYVTPSQLKILQRGSLDLTDNDGNHYAVSHVDSISIGSDKTRVLLISETANLIYGKTMGNFALNTGRVYTGSIVVASNCIYSYDGGVTNYVRLVTSEGEVLGEAQVEVGVTVGSHTCVTGVEEGQYCDSAYKSVVEG